MQNVIVLYGPTAVGKSAIAVELAKLVNGEIISADSMQIYKHLNIGSAKITKEEMDGIKHHLLDIKEPTEEYSVSEFCQDSKNKIKEILSRGHQPIIVGGTGLYLKALIEGYDFANTSKNEQFRKELEQYSNDKLYNKILNIEGKCEIDKNNKRRLIRYLEILKYGKTLNKNIDSDYNYKIFAIVDDRQKIYDRINNRVDRMINNGLLDEAKFLLGLNLPESNQAIKAIGYKELFPYLQNQDSLDNCLNLLKQKSRNYAKRQFTFINQFDNVVIINFQGIKETTNLIAKNLENK